MGISNSNAREFSEAHRTELGHHMQDELGILPRAMRAEQAASG